MNPVGDIAYNVPPGSVNTVPVTTQVFPGDVTLSLIVNVPNEYSSEYSTELSAQFVIWYQTETGADVGTEGVTLGVILILGVTLIVGVTLILVVTEGVILGVTLIEGVIDGVTDGVTEGVNDGCGVIDGVADGVKYGLLIHWVSNLIKNVISVLDDNGIGAANLATANKSPASLYNPTSLAYGENSEPEIDPVVKSFNIPKYSEPVGLKNTDPPTEALYGYKAAWEPDSKVGL